MRLQIDVATIDEQRNVRLAGSVRPCPGGGMPYLVAAYYTKRTGRLGMYWYNPEPEVFQFDKSATLKPEERAVCIVSGWQETDDGSYAHHEFCVAPQRDHRGRLTLVRIPPDDPRVRMPIDVLDDGRPGYPCATCL